MNKHSNSSIIIGIDEAGRGPLAGPVVSASVILAQDFNNASIKDSKKLSANKRKILNQIIQEYKGNYHSFGIIDNQIIDQYNILNATLMSMLISLKDIDQKVDKIIIDGNKVPNEKHINMLLELQIINQSEAKRLFNLLTKMTPIIKGDDKYLEIASASILAKIKRDGIMLELSKIHSEYKWNKNKGYGTKEHIEAIKQYGLTKYHRESFLKC